MSGDVKIQRVRQGYQPMKNEITKGYRPTQPVDMSNLKIPKNLGDAAVMPQNNGNPSTALTPQKKD